MPTDTRTDPTANPPTTMTTGSGGGAAAAAAAAPLARWNPVFHTGLAVVAVACPLAMLVPPRRMDVRFLALSAMFSLSTNQLTADLTGQSLYSRFGRRAAAALGGPDMPDGARRTRELIRQEKAARGLLDNDDKKKEGRGIAGFVNRIWTGVGKGDGKTSRVEAERKTFEEGKGISDLMMDQIREVWTGAGAGAGAKADESKKRRDGAKIPVDGRQDESGQDGQR